MPLFGVSLIHCLPDTEGFKLQPSLVRGGCYLLFIFFYSSLEVSLTWVILPSSAYCLKKHQGSNLALQSAFTVRDVYRFDGRHVEVQIFHCNQLLRLEMSISLMVDFAILWDWLVGPC